MRDTKVTAEALINTPPVILYEAEWRKAAVEVINAYLNPWISVEERLPEEDSWFLAVSDASKRVVFVTYTTRSRGDDTMVFKDPNWIELRGGIICWMPLPHPPKE